MFGCAGSEVTAAIVATCLHHSNSTACSCVIAPVQSASAECTVGATAVCFFVFTLCFSSCEMLCIFYCSDPKVFLWKQKTDKTKLLKHMQTLGRC